MKGTKLKMVAASAAMTLSLLSGCYAKLEIIRQPQHKEQIETNERIEKYKNLMEKILKYEDLIPGKDYAEGKIIIGFDEGTTLEDANNFIESHDDSKELELLTYYSEIELAVVKVPEGKEKAYALFFQNMSDETIVEHADLNYIAKILKGKDEIVPERILICFDKGTTEEQANSFIENHDLRDEMKMVLYRERLRLAEVKVPEGGEEYYAHYFNRMRDETIVQFAEPDYMNTIQKPNK